MTSATKASERERVLEVLRQAVFADEWWLTFDQVAERAQITDRRQRVRLSGLLSRMGDQGAIRIDRSRGRLQRRFALLTPQEFRELQEALDQLHETGALSA